ncbi:MAG: 4-alpha-glucanotransferase [bacterium]|nr:4-alpha-glucanotransferase [bacterium]
MSNRYQQALRRILGISTSYNDAWDQPKQVAPEVINALLTALGYPASTEQEAQWSLEKLIAEKRNSLMPAVLLHYGAENPLTLSLSVPELLCPFDHLKDSPFEFSVELESGDRQSAKVVSGSVKVRKGKSGTNRVRLQLETRLPEGYHSLVLSLDGRVYRTEIIACYGPCSTIEDLSTSGSSISEERPEKPWGVALQLYSLKSVSSWGIGDFGDLKKLGSMLAEQGCSFIGLNPIHTPLLFNLDNYSPYSPGSRKFINPLYISINAIPEAHSSPEYEKLLSDDGLLNEISRQNDSSLVNYQAVWTLKRRALFCIFREFNSRANVRCKQFERFVIEGGELLDCYARFEVTGAAMKRRESNCWGFPVWPELVQTNLRNNKQDLSQEEVLFIKWLQWVAHTQLLEVKNCLLNAGMKVGLYLDLALSSDRASFDAWQDMDSYAMASSVGAPPDVLNLKGQNWGFAPLKPEALKNSGFKEFRQVISTAMRYAGAIRLDHIMALMRLYCIPQGMAAGDGAYVRYFLRELMAVVALESRRNNCLVIGEDLGTVPTMVRQEMTERKLYSYTVVQFMSDWSGEFRDSSQYPAHSLVTPGTHDTATLPGWWSEDDIALRQQLDLFPEGHNPDDYRNGRKQEKRGLLRRLVHEGVLAPYFLDRADEVCSRPIEMEIVHAVGRFCQKVPSALACFPIEDILLGHKQINIPGITTDYPCWRVKQEYSLEDEHFVSSLRSFSAALSER